MNVAMDRPDIAKPNPGLIWKDALVLTLVLERSPASFGEGSGALEMRTLTQNCIHAVRLTRGARDTTT